MRKTLYVLIAVLVVLLLFSVAGISQIWDGYTYEFSKNYIYAEEQRAIFGEGNLVDVPPYVELYKKCRIAVCVGQGSWEEDSLNDTRELDNGFKRLGVPALVDYWGYDKPHDWPSWLEQVPHFLYRLLD